MSPAILLASFSFAADLPPELEARYLKRALVVDGTGDSWGVYRNGKAVSAKWLAAETHDEPLNSRLKHARVGAFVATGVLAGGAVVTGGAAMACTMLFVSTNLTYDAYGQELREPTPYGTYALGFAAGTIVLASGATVIPLVVMGQQRDVTRYYDEARARELVDAYNTELRGRLTPAASGEVHLWVAGTGVGVAGTF